MSILYLDLETVPTQKEGAWDEIRKTIKPPATYKKPESIEKWYAINGDAETDSVYKKTSLDGISGEIICIGYAINDETPKVIGRKLGESEADMLRAFFADLNRVDDKNEGFMWVGHNHTGFDLRYIYQRCVINQVQPTVKLPYDAKPWDSSVFDTMVEWRGVSGRGAGKLDTIAKALGLGGKTEGIDGSMVWDYINTGRYEEVFRYCMDDVELTRAIYKRLNFIGAK